MTTEQIQDIINQYSDYNMHEPFWINLTPSDIELTSEEKQKISDYLNEYFEEHGPDAREDFTAFTSRLMKHETAEAALKYAFEKANIEYDHEIIDGVGSIEVDGRENDPVTGELLHGYPIHDPSIIEELEYLIEEDELSKDDWRWLDMVCNGIRCLDYKRVDRKVEEMLHKVVLKFHSV